MTYNRLLAQEHLIGRHFEHTSKSNSCISDEKPLFVERKSNAVVTWLRIGNLVALDSLFS